MTAQLGDKIRVAVKFTDITRAEADPDAVHLLVRDPDGTETELFYGVGADVVRDAPGEYHSDVALLTPGEWWFRWEGVGTLNAATESPLQVAGSEFATANQGSSTHSSSVPAAPSCAPTLTADATGTSVILLAGDPSSAPNLTAGAIGGALVAGALSSAPSLAADASGVRAFVASLSSSPALSAIATGTFILLVTEENGTAMTEEDGATAITDE